MLIPPNQYAYVSSKNEDMFVWAARGETFGPPAF
jgi:hypothetical protein